MLDQFLAGAASISLLVIALFFLRFWKRTHDRLFLFFAGAFTVLMIERIIRAMMAVENEWAPGRLFGQALRVRVDHRRRRGQKSALLNTARSSGIRGRLGQTAQDLRDAPGLRNTGARRVRLFGVEDFADRADARVVEVLDETIEKTGARQRDRPDALSARRR